MDTSSMSSHCRWCQVGVRTAHQSACEAEQFCDAHHIHSKGCGTELAVLGEAPLLLCTIS